MEASTVSVDPAVMLDDTEDDARPQSQLDKLPEELVSNIALRLDYDDITSLRLSCRTLEARSFHDFASEYFSAKGFMLSTESLKALDGIASDKRLRKYLHSIYFVTAWFSESAFQCSNGCHCSWRPTVRQSDAYRLYIKDQEKLKNSGDGKQMLIEAFKKLPALTSLYLADSPNHGEDLENAELYGLRKMIRRTGRAPSYCPTTDKNTAKYADWCTYVWKVMCSAVSRSEISTVVRFGAQVLKTPDGLSVNRDLKLNEYTLAGMTKGLQNLKSVRFSIRAATVLKKDRKTDRAATLEVVHSFAKMLSQPQLEDVVVSYDMSSTSGLVHMGLVNNLNLGNIKKMSIDGVYIHASSLMKMIHGLTSVADLQLSWSNLTKGNWVPVLQAIQKLEKLDHLHLMWLQEAGCKVYFLPQREPEDEEHDWLDDDGGVGGFDEDDDDDGTDDDSLPDLEPAPGFDDYVANGGPVIAEPPPVPDDHDDFTAPGYEGHSSLERGYYICLKGQDQMKKHLPIFIKEYNLGESLDDHHHHHHGMPFPIPPPGAPVGPGGQAALNAMMNAFLGPMGPPPAGHAPPPPGAMHNAGAHGGGGFGPPPPGFVTVGNGPGYQIAMGAMAVPGMPPPPAHGGGGHGQGGGHGAGAAHGGAGAHGGHGAANGHPAPATAAPANGGTHTHVGLGVGVAGGQANAGAPNDFGAYFESEEEDGGWDSPPVDDVD